MLAQDPRHHDRVGRERETQLGVRERRFEDRDIRERWVAEDEIERSAGTAVEEREDVRGDDRRAVRKAGGLEVATERPHGLHATLHERDRGGATRERLDAERARAGEEVQ